MVKYNILYISIRTSQYHLIRELHKKRKNTYCLQVAHIVVQLLPFGPVGGDFVMFTTAGLNWCCSWLY